MPSSKYTTTVDLPVEARLVLLTVDGREVEVTPEILKKFTYNDRQESYSRFNKQLVRGLGLDPNEDEFSGAANTIQDMVSCALFYSHDFDYASDPQDPEDEDAINAARMVAELRATFTPTP
jgi:hypothetical protein